MMGRVTRRWRVLGVCAVLALAGGVAAGCGSDEDDDATSAGSTAATTQQQRFTGEPVTVYLQAPLKTPVANTLDVLAAVRAGVRAINEKGGLDGHEVKVEVCNDTDANAELECVRKAVADEAIAFLGSSFFYNPKAGQAALVKAGIPSIAPLAIQAVEYSSPANFPIDTTSLGTLACPQQLVQTGGAKKVGAIAQDLPVQKELLQTVEGVAAATKVPYGAGVFVPQSQTDFSSAVQQLADSGADGVVDVLVSPTQTAFFTAMRSVGQEFTAYCTVPSAITFDVLKQLGDQVDGFYVSYGLPATDEASAAKLPLVKAFRDEMQAAADAGDADAALDRLQSPGNAFNGWLAVHVLERVAPDVKGALTSKSLLAALNKATVDLSGAGLPVIDFSRPVPAPGFERLFNPLVRLSEWDAAAGDFVAVDDEPVNVLELLGALQQAAAKG